MSTGNKLNHKSQIDDDIDYNDKDGKHDTENENKQFRECTHHDK